MSPWPLLTCNSLLDRCSPSCLRICSNAWWLSLTEWPKKRPTWDCGVSVADRGRWIWEISPDGLRQPRNPARAASGLEVPLNWSTSREWGPTRTSKKYISAAILIDRWANELFNLQMTEVYMEEVGSKWPLPEGQPPVRVTESSVCFGGVTLNKGHHQSNENLLLLRSAYKSLQSLAICVHQKWLSILVRIFGANIIDMYKIVRWHFRLEKLAVARAAPFLCWLHCVASLWRCWRWIPRWTQRRSSAALSR